MNTIELMMSEHENIRRVLRSIRKICMKILNGEEVDYKIFYEVIDFVRNYADKHHHKKEENVLFKKMSEKLDKMISEGPVKGMLIEHDMGRFYIRNLEEAVKKVEAGELDARLDIIANAISYANLLDGHIEKENSVIYKIASRSLSKEDMEDIDRVCMGIEKDAEDEKLQENYIAFADRLEEMV